MAFVLIQHLDPHHASALTSILAKATSMKVIEARDKLAVQPNEVYVIAPATEVILDKGQLRVTPRPATAAPQMPIDTFLISLAGDCRSNCAGIILSGTGTDGTKGLQAIRLAGGITFAQDSTAAHHGMPQSAINAGCVDFVLPPERIAAEISRRPAGSTIHHSDQTASSETADDRDLDRILKLLTVSSGIDFVNYKSPTLRRRIDRRMKFRRLKTLSEYLDCLASDATELTLLEEEVLIHVTSFFRDPDTFDGLKTSVFPELIAGRSEDADIRIWVPGCSSGEEVYSIVICLFEFLEAQKVTFPIKVFATDVSERVIEKARAGVYPASISKDISPERLQRFFKQIDAGYQIEKSVRDACVFARQDITQDPPFSQIDLISCRNVLIYLGPILHSRVFPIFHYALKPEGYLVLGSAESVGGFGELFEPVDKQRRFYQRKNVSSHVGMVFTRGNRTREGAFSSSTPMELAPRAYDVREEADRVVLDRYCPPGVVIDEGWKIVQFRGHTGRFLEPAPGLPSNDLLQMVRRGVLPSLRSALEAVKNSGLPARRENVPLDDFQVHLEIIPIAVPPEGAKYFVVLFEENPQRRDESVPAVQPVVQETESEQEIERLKRELAATKAYLQSVIETKDVSNEELRAANEEVVSSNEELQSTNEELETAKEELQSTNEELETVNDELESRIRTTIQLNDELTNLITSVRIPIVILGQDLRVRRFSPRARDVFNLLPSDVGRLITDLTLRINVLDMKSLITRVLETLEVHEEEITDLSGHWYSLLIRPYRTSENKIDGAIILLMDIHGIKERELQVIEARNLATSIVETLHESLLILDPGLRIRSANNTFYKTFQLSPEEAENQLVFSLSDGQWNIPELRSQLESVLRTDGDLVNFMIEREFAGIGKRVMQLNARRLKEPAVATAAQPILLAIDDVTERHEALRNLKSAEQLMQTIVEGAINAIVAINEQGIIQTFNRAAEKMFGYAAADAIGKNVSLLMPQPYRDDHDSYMHRYLSTGVKQVVGLGRVVLGQRRDGTTFPAELGLSEIVTDGRRLFTGIMVDISERRALEREVLDIATHEQQRIGQDIHDTTGQELTGMSYLAQSLVESLQEKKLAAEAEKAAKLVSGLESALLQLRHIAKGLVPVELDSRGLMEALENLAIRTEERSHVDCTFTCEVDVLLADVQIATQLFLIANEAVNNCLKHAKATHIEIKLDSTGSEVILRVHDDGIGIQKNQRPNGVGLHIMAYRARALGGELEIERGKDGGTRLLCRIPISTTNAK